MAKKAAEKALNIDNILFNCRTYCVRREIQARFLKNVT